MSTLESPEGLTIRPFDNSDRDYEASVAIWNALWPDEPSSVEGSRYADETREKKYLLQKLMVELDGEIAAMASYREPPWTYAPGKYDIQIRVLPEFQRRGIGSAIYDYILERLDEQELKPVNLHSDAREDQAHSVKFLTDRGFEQMQRQQVSRLDVASFDARPFEGAVARFSESGLTMKTLEEFERDEPNARPRLYEKTLEFFKDVPFFEEVTEFPYEQFEKMLDSPAALRDGFFVALDGDEVVGTTNLWKKLGKPGTLSTGLTAVARSHRRKGMATALKVRAIEYAKGIGAEVIQTDNEENNPMYDLNVRLGFKPTPAWLLFRKLLNEEAAGGAPAREDR